MAYQSADVVAALDMIRRAVAADDDLTQLFSEWSGLERRALAAAINSPGAAPGPVVYGDSLRVSPASVGGAAAAAQSAPSDDPCPEPPVDRQQAPPSAHAGGSGAPSSPAELPPAGKPIRRSPPARRRRFQKAVRRRCGTSWAGLAYKHHLPTAEEYYRRYSTVLPDRITPSTVIPTVAPAAPPAPSRTSVPAPVDYQDRIAEELRRQFADESRQQRTVEPQVKAMPAAPAPSPPAQSGASRRAPTPTPREMYPDADPITGAGFPILPRRPGQNASPAELERHRREYRRLAHFRRMLCSQEWRDHVELMGKSGVRSDVPLPEPLRPLTVANLRTSRGPPPTAPATAMVPAAAAAAYYVLRALPPGVRGGRIPEKIPGEIWCVGWCGHPCTNGRCRGIPGRCLRPVLIRAGGTVDLDRHDHHECEDCHEQGPRRYLTVAVFYRVDFTDGLVAGDVGIEASGGASGPTQSQAGATGARKEGGRRSAAGARLGTLWPHAAPPWTDGGLRPASEGIRRAGGIHHLPLLPTAGAVDVDSALARASALVTAGVPATVLEALAGWRKDIPLRRDTRRACKRTAFEAALPENREAALAEIDENILAKSSQAPFQSRVRTWQEACETWAVAPWPISAEAVRKVAATFRRGGYRSVQNYFDAAVSYQEYSFAAIFAVDRLVALVSRVDPPGSDAWSPWVTAHAVDALILADIDVADGTVALRLPLHKTATGGEVELTQRQLRCACGATVAPLCPYHAALRHVSRLRRAGRWVRGAPLFPDGTGDTWEKSEAVLFFRRVLLAAGIQLTTTDHNGATVQLFNGHLARVAGAAWLASKGVNTPIIQLLGRWSSAAVERYVQAASEATAPPALGHQPPLALEDGEPAQEETPPREDHSPTVAFEPGPVRPETVKQVAVAPPEHLIYNERQKRAHAPDPTEASSDRFLWKACFPKAPSADGVGSPTEEAASPVASSSDSDGILLSCRSPPLTAPPFIPAGPLVVIMAMGPQLVADVLTDFDDLATSAGAGPDLVEYLKARSLNRTATLALVADEWSDVDARVFQPFRDGDEIAGKTYKATPAEQPVVRAIIRHMWSEARRQWNEFSTPTPTPSTAAPPPATLPTMVGEKPPRTFPEWTDLVARYNAVQLGGEPRSFPAERLVGAEEVLARIHWEHTKSKLYTPLGLGEILAAVVAYWDATAHQLAMSMRLARTFEEVTSAIMADQTRHSSPPPSPARLKDRKGKGRGRQPHRRPEKQRRQEQDWEDDGANKDWGRDHYDDRRQPQNRWKQTGRDEGRDQGWRQSWGRGRQDQWDQDDRRHGKVPGSHCASTVVRPALKRTRRAPKIILLSFFDGIGAAPALVENLFGQPTLALAWEIDATCRRLASARLPWLVHRGDVTSESPGSVAAAIRKADPTGECTVVVTAAPPCQDFSRIGPATGHAGERGSLFLLTVDMFNQILADLSDRRVAFLFENVVMEPADAAKISDALGVQPVLVCGSDFGWISRPRLWWMSADLTGALVDPASGRPLHWSKQGSYRRLRLEAPR
ncbi:unnamed protein product [Symbiodinium sp. CCMP2592]|nr:unnamed protein product [Symbiodinium sp. CCMP2592]